jgi:hypothetical protein
MPQPILRPFLLLAASCAAYAQTAGASLEFEVASNQAGDPAGSARKHDGLERRPEFRG